MLYLRSLLGPNHGIVGTNHRSVRFEEEQRLLRNIVAHLFGMVGVVAANADDFAPGNDGCKESNIIKAIASTGKGDAGVDGVAGDGGHLIALDDAKEVGVRFSHGCETSDAHGMTLPALASRP